MSEGQLGGGNRSALPAPERGTAAGGLLSPQPPMPLTLVACPDTEPVEVRANEHRLRGWTLDRLVAWVCADLGAAVERVRAGGRSRSESRARAVIGLFATRELGCSVLEAGGATGVTAGPMSRSIRRGEDLVSQLGIRLPAVPPREC